MKQLFLFLLLFVYQSTSAQLLIRINNEEASWWQYGNGDEFNGNELNRDFWDTGYPWARHLYCSRDLNYYSDGLNFKEQNGIMQIIAKYEHVTEKAIPYEAENYVLKCNEKPDAKNLMSFDYTSGILFSKKQYSYGLYQARFKNDGGNGLWPAFWLYGSVEGEEIDIFEISGKQPEYFHVDVHCKDGCDNYPVWGGIFKKGWGANLKTNRNWLQGFNTISAEWQPDYIKWYLNGQPAALWKGRFNHPMWIIANMAVTSDNGNYTGAPDPKQFPKSMSIDYIRRWEKITGTSYVMKAGNLETTKAKGSENESKIITKKRPVNKRKLLRQQTAEWIITLNSDNQLVFNREAYDQQSITVDISNSDKKSLFHKETDAQTINFAGPTLKAGQYTIEVKRNEQISRRSIEVL